MEPFLARVDECLMKKGKKRPWLAKEANIGLSTINSWFSKDRLPRVDDAFRVASALGVPLHYLITGQRSREASTNPAVRRIVRLLEPLDSDQIMELVGVIKNYIYFDQSQLNLPFDRMPTREELTGPLPDSFDDEEGE
jgi:transcriptional regulator with XRE-family HTH domain